MCRDRRIQFDKRFGLDGNAQGRVMAMKKQSKSARKKKKIKVETKNSTTKAPKPRAIPMKFNVLNFVLGSSIAKSRGVSSAKATNE